MRKCVLVLLTAGLLSCGACAAGSPAARRPDALAQMDFREVVTKAKDKVFPAVVFIKCLQESNESGKKISQEISGSGVLLSPTGEVLTNWHVIDKAVEVRCLLFDGRAADAKIIGSDKDTDLGLLQLKLPPDTGPLPYATMGDSSRLKEGDFVMAMGAPWGLSRSVTIGIISCMRRYLPGHSQYSLWLQSCAPISPGNSGGPLVNTAGEVIGINTLGFMSGGDVGFAVPSATVKIVTEQLRRHGKADWCWTGIQLQPLKDFNKNIYFNASDGVIVAETDPESPARRAGILATDRIVRIGDTVVTAERDEDLPAVERLLGQLPLGQPVKIALVRDSKPLEVELTPREKGKVEGEELDCPRWDMTVKTINQFDNADLYLHRKKGVFIYGVKDQGNASSAGLHAQDIILKIDGQEVVTLEDVKAIHKTALANVDSKFRYVFEVLRNGLLRQVVLNFSRDYEKE